MNTPSAPLEHLVEIFFKNFDGQDVFCEVLDVKGTIVFINDYFEKRHLRLSKKDVGRNLFTLVNELGPIYSKYIHEELRALYQEVVQEKIHKSFFSYARTKSGNCFIRRTNLYPILNSVNKEEVIGTFALSHLANPLGPLTSNIIYNNDNIKRTNLPTNSNKNIKLTVREHEVLFLAMLGFSQYEIAKYLNVTRVTIQKIVSVRLCDKLQINSSKSEDLVNKALELKLYNYFPPTLLKYHILEMSNDNDIISAFKLALKNEGISPS